MRCRRAGGDKEGQAKGDGQNGKSGERQTTGKAKDDNPKVRTNLTDVFRDVWGHLPEMRRQEMDAMVDLALKGIGELTALQNQALAQTLEEVADIQTRGRRQAPPNPRSSAPAAAAAPARAAACPRR